ncbi:MAG TPA: CUB domain-containing protein, partial [Oceanipulchritudo sp.]|nr:CUB domain-containing protein [Oceanipulchritudo sp.]
VRLKESNYGDYVDLVAPGSAIVSASSLADDEYIEQDGTSMAAAIVAGAAALLKVKNPEASIEEITAILKNTASRVEPAQQGEILYGGKLGAGLVNLDRALNYDLDQQPGRANLQSNTHQGYLVQYQPRKSPTLWRIRPFGEVHGFWFDLKLLDGDPGDSRLKFLQAGTDPDQPFLDLKLSEIKDRVYVPGTQAMVLLEPDPEHPEFRLLVEYASKPIDQSTLYCQGTRKITAEGLIEDGSGQSPYSPQSDCKWLITAPEGKVVHIEFLEFDTEANTDWLYFFNGAGTNEKIMAVFSGPNIPPKLTTWHNQVLLWFVTDDKAQGQGWKAAISFIDPPPPAAP